MSDYDYSAAVDLFDWSGDDGAGTFEQAALGNAIDMDGSFGNLDGLTDEQWTALGDYFAANPDALDAAFQPGALDNIKSAGGGIVNGIMKGWNGLGANGQLVAGSALVGGLSNYMQQRQRDSELQQMGAMSEEQFNRQLQLKRAPVNKVANVDHFKGVVNSLRGGR